MLKELLKPNKRNSTDNQIPVDTEETLVKEVVDNKKGPVLNELEKSLKLLKTKYSDQSTKMEKNGTRNCKAKK